MYYNNAGDNGRKVSSGSDVGYIRLASFNKQTTEKFRQALLDLQKSHPARMVLDFRNNGGGLFPSAVEVGRMLIDKGDIVLIADANGVRDVYEADGTAIDSRTPITVLVNRGTASASEVLAGALKDGGRATLVGENTFGKGLIQTLVPLSDGSAVAITVAKYQTPAGVDINKVGISPNTQLDAETLAAIPLGAPDAFCRWAAANPAPNILD
jgi:C-terminal peptidase prc